MIQDFERTYLEKLLLASQVILEAAPDGDLVCDPLEVELGIFKDRVELLLLHPDTAGRTLPWHALPEGEASWPLPVNGEPAD